MSVEFLRATMEAAEKGEIPDRVSNKMLWALAIDAKKDRKAIKVRISRIELKAAVLGGATGLIAAIAALIAAL
jgi:hypothetical protein